MRTLKQRSLLHVAHFAALPQSPSTHVESIKGARKLWGHAHRGYLWQAKSLGANPTYHSFQCAPLVNTRLDPLSQTFKRSLQKAYLCM